MISRRALLGTSALLGGAAAVALWRGSRATPIRVGVLHSLTGTMGLSERPVVDATLLAIEELNAAGGVLGHPVEAVVRDGRSDWPTFAKAAEQLITEEKVVSVFGCWTSASRKTVKAIFERHGNLLFYPLQYEGLEQSPNIVYCGSAPNQQLTPGVAWALENLGRRVFLLGSDYIYPRIANRIMRAQIQALGAKVVGEHYLKLGTTELGDLLKQLQAAKPEVILNTINGDTNIAFFRALRQAGISAQSLPTVSFSIAEPELAALDPAQMVGEFAVWSYFQALETPENLDFVSRFRARYGMERVTSEPLEAAYLAVKLWAQAVERAGHLTPRAIREALSGLSMAAPGGPVYLDPDNQHLWRTPRIGRIRPGAQFSVVWSADRPVRPVPFPDFRSRTAWARELEQLQASWGGQWAAP